MDDNLTFDQIMLRAQANPGLQYDYSSANYPSLLAYPSNLSCNMTYDPGPHSTLSCNMTYDAGPHLTYAYSPQGTVTSSLMESVENGGPSLLTYSFTEPDFVAAFAREIRELTGD